MAYQMKTKYEGGGDVACTENLMTAEELNARLTPEERSENASKAGKASVEARRRKRTMREAAELFLSLPVKDDELKGRMVQLGIDANDVDNQMAVIVGLTMKATSGDSKAAKVLAELLGEGQKQLEVSGPNGAPLMAMDMSTLSDDQLRMLAAQSKKEEDDE